MKKILHILVLPQMAGSQRISLEILKNLPDDEFEKHVLFGTGILRNLIRNSFLGACMAFRRELLDKTLPCPRHSVPHDIWLGLLASYYGKVSYLPVPLMIYRGHEATVSASCDKSFFPFWFKIRYRAHCLTAFLKRISAI